MKRTTLSLAVVVAVLALVVGLATVTRPSESKAAPAPAAASVPVQQAEASCPSVRQLPNSTTTLTALAPPARTAVNTGEEDGASIVELGDRTRSRAELDAPGTLAAWAATLDPAPILCESQDFDMCSCFVFDP